MRIMGHWYFYKFKSIFAELLNSHTIHSIIHLIILRAMHHDSVLPHSTSTTSLHCQCERHSIQVLVAVDTSASSSILPLSMPRPPKRRNIQSLRRHSCPRRAGAMFPIPPACHRTVPFASWQTPPSSRASPRHTRAENDRPHVAHAPIPRRNSPLPRLDDGRLGPGQRCLHDDRPLMVPRYAKFVQARSLGVDRIHACAVRDQTIVPLR